MTFLKTAVYYNIKLKTSEYRLRIGSKIPLLYYNLKLLFIHIIEKKTGKVTQTQTMLSTENPTTMRDKKILGFFFIL